LIKYSRTVKKRWYSNLELGEVLTTSHVITYGVTTCIFFTAELRAKKSDLWLANVAVLLWEDELSCLMIVFKRL